MHDGSLKKLRKLEEMLHSNEVRRDRRALDALLHPEFEEVGRSGQKYGRSEILAEVTQEETLPKIPAQDYSVSLLAEGVALLTYRSAHADGEDRTRRHTRRSSLWVRTPGGWKLRFHQGTPEEGKVWDAT